MSTKAKEHLMTRNDRVHFRKFLRKNGLTMRNAANTALTGYNHFTEEMRKRNGHVPRVISKITAMDIVIKGSDECQKIIREDPELNYLINSI